MFSFSFRSFGKKVVAGLGVVLMLASLVGGVGVGEVFADDDVCRVVDLKAAPLEQTGGFGTPLSPARPVAGDKFFIEVSTSAGCVDKKISVDISATQDTGASSFDLFSVAGNFEEIEIGEKQRYSAIFRIGEDKCTPVDPDVKKSEVLTFVNGLLQEHEDELLMQVQDVYSDYNTDNIIGDRVNFASVWGAAAFLTTFGWYRPDIVASLNHRLGSGLARGYTRERITDHLRNYTIDGQPVGRKEVGVIMPEVVDTYNLEYPDCTFWVHAWAYDEAASLASDEEMGPFKAFCDGECDSSTQPWRILQQSTTLGADALNEDDPCYDASGQSIGNRLEHCQELLAPLPGFGRSINTDPDSPERMTIGKYVNTLLRVVLGVMSIAAVIMIIFAGLKYMTSTSPNAKGDARDTIVNAFLGIIIAASIYLILNTINPNLLNLEPGIDPVSFGDIPSELNDDGSYTIARNGQKIIFQIGGETITKGMVWADVVARHDLKDLRPVATGLGFLVNRPDCQKVGDSGCTTLQFEEPIFKKLSKRLVDLASDCPECHDISQNTNGSRWIITGGSEAWLHSTHGPDAPVLDMVATNPSLNEFFSGQEEFPGGCKDWSLEANKKIVKRAKSEDTESCSWNPAPHWHVIFKH